MGADKPTPVKGQGPGLRRALAELLELPSEVVMNLPQISLEGNLRLKVENHQGIVHFEQTVIRIKVNIGILEVSGIDLLLREIQRESIIIEGLINSVQFSKSEGG